MGLVPVKSGTELAGSVERLFLEAFPEVERLPLEPLFRFADTDIADFYAIMDDGFKGLAYLVDGGELMLLLYLAVVPESRGRGLGTQTLEEVKRLVGDRCVYLYMEPLDDKAENSSQRVVRKAFYERCGFIDSGDVITPWNEHFTLMSWNGRVTPENTNRLFSHLVDIGLFCDPPDL